jgi:mRNA-degrading endonuclease RelE of RelBE toxin-antitoxin system
VRQVRLTSQAAKDLKAFDESTRDRIKEALRHLAENPLDGKPLKGKFQKVKVRSYRVWPYRILYRPVGSEWLDVYAIEHRKDVYRS